MKYIIHDVTAMPKDYVTAHCISTDCAMGKGVVPAFRTKYHGLKESCKQYVSNLGSAIGTVFRYETDAGVCYNLFTKEAWNSTKNMTYAQYLLNLTMCLRGLKQQMSLFGETKLAIPMIGCGLDGCDWKDVSKLIDTIFKDSRIEIVVCVLSQDILDKYNIKAS